MGRFFISYRRTGAAVAANWLKKELKRRLRGHDVFLDTGNVRAGETFPERLHREIATSDVMLVLIDETWTSAEGLARLKDTDNWVRREVELALRNKLRIVPICVDGAPMPSSKILPKEIAAFASYHAVEFRPERFDRDIRPLVDALRQALADSVASRQGEPLEDFVLPDKPVDLSKFVIIREMKDPNRCAAYAAVTAMETGLAVAGEPSLLNVDFVWKAAKKHDEMHGEGTSLTTVVYVIEHFGVPFRTVPSASSLDQMPSRKSGGRAGTHRPVWRKGKYFARARRLHQYERIGDELARNRPIFAAVKVFGSYDPWLKSHKTGIVEAPRSDDELLGGHAITIVRWDRSGIGFANACGYGWGNRGFGTITHELARQLLFEDMYWSVEVTL